MGYRSEVRTEAVVNRMYELMIKPQSSCRPHIARAMLHNTVFLLHSSIALGLEFGDCNEYADEVFRRHTSPALFVIFSEEAPQDDIAGGTCDSFQGRRQPMLAT